MSYRRLTSIYEDAKEKLWKGQQIDTWDKNKHIYIDKCSK